MRGRNPLAFLSVLVVGHALSSLGCSARTDETGPVPSSDLIRSKGTAAPPHASGSTKPAALTPPPPATSAAAPPSATQSAAPAPSASAVGTTDAEPFTEPSGSLRNPRKTPQPTLKTSDLKIDGGLPPEVVQRIVRQQYGKFRACYDDAKKADPKLGAGTIGVEFTIEKSGSVSGAKEAGSTLKDAKLGACFVDVYSKLSFPAPEGNKTAKVTVPALMTPMHATVNGKDAADVTVDDVKAALKDAGYTDIVVTPPKGAATPVVITAKSGAAKITITFVPAKRGEKDPTVSDEEKAKLAASGIVFDDGMYLAVVVEGGDAKANGDAYDKIVKVEELKAK
ncbi:MAG: AgmX/PglI C-terminal domain-containing protein [Polyangiaceae bacterium]